MSIRETLLVRRLRSRDEDAFKELLRLYQNRIYNLVYRFVGNAHEAEEVAQEVFVTVFKSIDTFRGDAQLSTWLYRVAVNHAKNRIKYLSRRAYNTTSELDAKSEAKFTPDMRDRAHAERPDYHFEGAQVDRLVQEAIAGLDDDQREIIVLRDVEGLSYEEIASICNLTEGTVKSRLHRARMALKERLSRRFGEEGP